MSTRNIKNKKNKKYLDSQYPVIGKRLYTNWEIEKSSSEREITDRIHFSLFFINVKGWRNSFVQLMYIYEGDMC